MPAVRLCAVFALLCRGLSAASLSLDVSSAFGWNQDPVTRLDLRTGDYRFVAVAWQPLHARSSQLLAGLSSSWLRVGPLSPAGVVREACGPLGFQAGSDVFMQRSGFLLDSSLPPRMPGALLMPWPRTLGLFWQRLPGGGEWAGCMASFVGVPGAAAEGFLGVSGPSPEDRGEEWTADSAPFAGGKVLCGAGRLALDWRPFAMTATLGASGSERALPGAFFHLHLCVRADPFAFFLLFAGSDAAYTSPSGEHPRDALLASAVLLLEGEAEKVDARLSRSVHQPGFAPGAFREQRTEASFRMEKTFTPSDDSLLSLRLEGGKIIHGAADGSCEPASRCAASAALHVSPVTLESGLGLSDSGGLSARAGAKATLDRYGSLVACDGSVLSVGRDFPAFSAIFSARLARRRFAVTVTAGLAEVRFRALPRDLGNGLRLSILWSSHSP